MQDIAGTVVKSASAYDGGTFVLCGLVALFGVWMWYFYIPDAKIKRENSVKNEESNRENSAKLTEATIAISQLVGENYKMTGDIKADIQSLKDIVKAITNDIGRLTNCATTVIQAMEKLAKEANIDLASELGEMRGTLKSTQGVGHG